MFWSSDCFTWKCANYVIETTRSGYGIMIPLKLGLKCQVNDKRDNFNVDIVNSPFMESNFPVSPAYGVC